MSGYFFDRDITKNSINDKSARKVLAHGKEMMVCHLYFETGAVGEAHRHPHTQCVYILSGSFEFNLEGDNTLIKAGDSVFVPSNALHGLVCLEKGELLDIFTPEREDFLV